MTGHPWHDIAIEPQLIGVVEIPAGSKHKYELDKKTGGLILDRIISRAVPYNYGFIPQSLSGDGDPLDVYMISEDPILPLTQVKLELHGVVFMTDNGEDDEKLICSVKGSDVPVKNFIEEHIAYYLANYKPGVVVNRVGNRDDAIRILGEARVRYMHKFNKGYP